MAKRHWRHEAALELADERRERRAEAKKAKPIPYGSERVDAATARQRYAATAANSPERQALIEELGGAREALKVLGGGR